MTNKEERKFGDLKPNVPVHEEKIRKSWWARVALHFLRTKQLKEQAEPISKEIHLGTTEPARSRMAVVPPGPISAKKHISVTEQELT